MAFGVFRGMKMFARPLPGLAPALVFATVLSVSTGACFTPQQPPPTPTAVATPTPATSPTASILVSIVLDPGPGATESGELDALDNGDGTTTLTVRMPAPGLLPWALYPDFDCTGTPTLDSQLPVALPDVENGHAEEVLDSFYFGEPLALVVFAAPGDDPIVACGVLPSLAWATDAPRPTTGPTSDPNASPEIVALVAAMEAAVLAGDRDGYLALIDLTDPVFAAEQTHFADDWIANPPTAYILSVTDVVVDGAVATGALVVNWAAAEQDMRRAALAVRFTQVDGAWRFAGEEWVTQQAEHFRIHVAPGLEPQLPAVTDSLPDIYEYVTTHFEWVPTTDMEIKVYTGPAELVAMTWLSLPDIRGWNEPGEALKLQLDPDSSPTSTIAHEFTHFLEFNRAGTARSRMPWWLSEGIASYFGYHYLDPGAAEARIQQVRDWAANGELADWDAMAVFEETPLELWPYVYAQGYAFSVFVTDSYGEAQRNRWLAAMAVESDIADATRDVLGLSFDDLAAQFVEWLGES
jgi:hypothetical protein